MKMCWSILPPVPQDPSNGEGCDSERKATYLTACAGRSAIMTVKMLLAELKTGIIQNFDGAYNTHRPFQYLIFESLESATVRAKEMVQADATIECILYDEFGSELAIIRPEQSAEPEKPMAPSDGIGKS
jgi:hypothetical protein